MISASRDGITQQVNNVLDALEDGVKRFHAEFFYEDENYATNLTYEDCDNLLDVFQASISCLSEQIFHLGSLREKIREIAHPSKRKRVKKCK